MNAVTNEKVSPVHSAGVNKKRRGGRGKGRKVAQTATIFASAEEKRFNIEGWGEMNNAQRKNTVQEYFSWAAELKLNPRRPFNINYKGWDKTSRAVMADSFTVWAMMRQAVERLAQSITRTLASAQEICKLDKGYAYFGVWTSLKGAFDAQVRTYLDLVEKTNTFRKENLVGDSMDIEAFDFEHGMVL